MRAAAPVPEPLWTFLYGRRRHRRHDVDHAAVLHGPAGPLDARLVDVSSGGMLLCLERADLRTGGTPSHPTGLVDRNIGAWFRVDLPGSGLSLEASLARLAWRPGDDEHVYLGCRFPRTLDDDSLKRLGIEPETGTGETPGRSPSACLPLRAGDGQPFTVELYAIGEDLRVPLLQGALTGAGEQTLVAHARDAGLDESVSRLDGLTLVVEVRKGLESLWTVRARPLAVRPVAPPDRGIEVVVLADSSPATLLTSGLTPQSEASLPA